MALRAVTKVRHTSRNKPLTSQDGFRNPGKAGYTPLLTSSLTRQDGRVYQEHAAWYCTAQWAVAYPSNPRSLEPGVFLFHLDSIRRSLCTLCAGAFFIPGKGVAMATLAGGASPVWSSPEFWVALPAIVAVLVFGAVTLAAVMRARREDVPEVLSIFAATVTRHVARMRETASLPPTRAPGSETSLPSTQASREDKRVCGETGEVR